MAHLLTFWQIEVVVGFYSASVSMWRHSVPDASLLQLCQSHLQLAWTFFEGCVDDELIDGTQVTLGFCAKRFLLGAYDDGFEALHFSVLTSV